MDEKKKRSNAQQAADNRYETKRAEKPRFGGRCTEEEKSLLNRLSAELGLSEKEVIFKALKLFDENHSN